MKYFAIYDANNDIYAYTPSEWGAREQAALIGGWYTEVLDEAADDE